MIPFLDQYQKLTNETAQYEHEGIDPDRYIHLGLMSELGELAGVVAKNDRKNAGTWGPESFAALRSEIGDCCWFIAQIAQRLNVSLVEIDKNSFLMIYDDDVDFSDCVKEEIVSAMVEATAFDQFSLEQVWGHLRAIALMAFGATDMNKICRENLDKLASRKQRGQIEGSGDNR